jgi:uncharacterized membrane protein
MHIELLRSRATTSDIFDSGFERWASLATAAALIAYGISRKSKYGIFLTAAAAPLAYRGVAGEWPRFGIEWQSGDTREALSGSHGIYVRESIRLAAPVDQVFAFWRDFENLPLARGPAGATVEWDAEIINEQHNKLIAWRSRPGSDVAMAGSVRFDTVRSGTESHVSVKRRS